MIDLSRPESNDADTARCYVIHEQNILVAGAPGQDWLPQLRDNTTKVNAPSWAVLAGIRVGK